MHPTETNPLWNQEISEGVCNSCNIRVKSVRQHVIWLFGDTERNAQLQAAMAPATNPVMHPTDGAKPVNGWWINIIIL